MAPVGPISQHNASHYPALLAAAPPEALLTEAPGFSSSPGTTGTTGTGDPDDPGRGRGRGRGRGLGWSLSSSSSSSYPCLFPVEVADASALTELSVRLQEVCAEGQGTTGPKANTPNTNTKINTNTNTNTKTTHRDVQSPPRALAAFGV